MHMDGAWRVPHDPRGGRTDKVVTEIRFMRTNHDAVKIMLDGIIDNLAMGFTANDIRGNAVKMRHFLPQDLTGPVETLLDDLFTDIGGDRTLRHLEYMQGDD